MIKGDYREYPVTLPSGKRVTGKVITSTTGVEYMVKNRMGDGGVGSTFHAERMRDHKKCVFKEYVPSPERRQLHRAIKDNIQTLIRNPITDDAGKALTDFVGPMDADSLIELPASHGFGYIMEKVDRHHFLSVPEMWQKPDSYPDARAVCKACRALASMFRRLHLQGWCYKDISENNIYINPTTGEVRIIDCDNIAVSESRTVLGTKGFVAPEVYETQTPDRYSDYFAIASLYYRIFTGGYPLYGRKVEQYLQAHDMREQDGAPTVYGPQMALFVFDPRDRSNSLKGMRDPQNPNKYKQQVYYWQHLPEPIRKALVQTFSTGLKPDNRYKRTTDRQWEQVYEAVDREAVVRCPHCGKYCFGSKEKTGICMFCHADLPLLHDLQEVVFRAKRDTSPRPARITARRHSYIPGARLHPRLTKDGWMTVMYSAKLSMLGARNNCTFAWTVICPDGSRKSCQPGKVVPLQVGMTIVIFPRQLQLTVVSIT